MSEPRPPRSPRDEAVASYERLKRVFGGPRSRSRRSPRREDDTTSVPFGRGREPRSLASVVETLSSELGWSSPLARSELLASWPELVGENTADRSWPVGISDGVLLVRCDSTSWATQLRLMRLELLAHIAERFPEAGIESIRFQGPDVPSWKRGRRAIQGRGPRDTYG